MFVLRKISGNGIEMNIGLGNSYTLIHKDRNPEEFQEECVRCFGDKVDDLIYAFVSTEGGKDILPISNKQLSFIMTERGTTFAKI